MMKCAGRFLHSLAMFILIVTLVSGFVSTKVCAVEEITVNIGGTNYTLGESESPALPTGLSWDNAEKVLTLSNYTGTYICVRSIGVDLNLHLNGDNVLTGGYISDNACIVANAANIVITADAGASLEATSQGDGEDVTVGRECDAVPVLIVNRTNNGGIFEMKGGDIKLKACNTGENSKAICCDARMTVTGTANVSLLLDATNACESERVCGIGEGNLDFSTSGNVYVSSVGTEDDANCAYGFGGAKITGTGTVWVESDTAFKSKPDYESESYQVYGAYNKGFVCIRHNSLLGSALTEKEISLTAPVVNEYVKSTISDEQYIGYITWSDGEKEVNQFDEEIVYTATLTIVPKVGYSYKNIEENFFTCESATSVTNEAGSNVVVISYPATEKNPNKAYEELTIEGVTKPKAGETPVTTIIETDEYTGTVSFSPADTKFGYNTVYTATITLAPKSGYTNLGVAANSFSVTGATSTTNEEDSNVITAVFPETEYGQILEIDGREYALHQYGVSPALPKGLTWDPTKCLITMENYKGGYISSEKNNTDLNLHLKGENELAGGGPKYNACIYVDNGSIAVSADEGASLEASTQGNIASMASVFAENVTITGGNVSFISKNEAMATYGCKASLDVSGDANVSVVAEYTKNTGSNNIYAVSGDINVSTSGDVKIKALGVKGGKLIGVSSRYATIAGTGSVYVEAGEAYYYKPIYEESDYQVHGSYNGEKMCITHKDYPMEAVDEAVAETCSKDGLTEGSHCAVCGEILKEQTTIPLLGHMLEDKLDKATLVQDGKIYKKCSRCEAELDVKKIAKVNSVLLETSSFVYDGLEKKPAVVVKDSENTLLKADADYEVTYTDNVKVGTATVTVVGKGNYNYTKILKFNINETDEDTVKEGTTIEDGNIKATVKVTSLDNKTVEYVAPKKGKQSKVVIPAAVTIDGEKYKVTSIAANAFKNNSNITSVTVGKYVKTIGNKAFYKCKKLKTVKLGTAVKVVGKEAFAQCKKLSKVTLNSKVTTINDKAFYKCTALSQITIPSKVTKIGKSAFYGCKKLKKITIKTKKLTKKTVGSEAFKGVYSKVSVKVPSSKLKSYKALLKSKGLSKKAKIKK